MADKRGVMTIDRRPGKRIRVEFADGGYGWITCLIADKVIDGVPRRDVRLVLDFPQSVRLDREEIYEANQQRDRDNADSTR